MSGLRQDPGDRAGDPRPVFLFGRELLPPGLRELVELRRPVRLRRAPLGLDPVLLLETMKRRIERALGDLQDVLGDLLNALGDRPAVHWSAGQSSKNEEIQRALEQVGLAAQRASCRVTTIIR